MSTNTQILHGMMASIDKVVGGPVRAAEQTMNADWPNELPKPENIVELITRGFITLEDGERYLKWHGIDLNASGTKPPAGGLSYAETYQKLWQAAFMATSEQPTMTEMFEVSNRWGWTDEQTGDTLKLYGYYYDTWRTYVSNLRYDIPGPSDLVRFSVRHVWEPDILAKLGYDAEFPGTIIDYWHSAKGLDYPLFTGPFQKQIDKIYGEDGAAFALANNYAEAGLPEPTWARAYWWSHWILPSPQQAYQMWFKLDPLRDRSRDAPEMEGQEFSFEQLELLLRANDYAPKWRPLLAAISRPNVGMRFLREFCRNGVYDYKDILEWARRWGYSPRDQRDIADAVYRSCTAPQTRKISLNCYALIKRAYEAGIISDADLEPELTKCLTKDEDPKPVADVIRTENSIVRVKQVTSAVRSLFLRGKLSADEARARLSDAGITSDHVAEDLTQWELERLEQGREATVAQALKWACDGLITLQDFQTRAANLGYQPQDVAPLTAQVQQCQATLLAKAAAATAKADQQKVKAQQAALKAAAQAVRQSQRDLASHGSPNKLREWFCQGFLTEGDLYSRLRFLGWPDSDITRLVGDCKGVRDAKLPGLLTPPG